MQVGSRHRAVVTTPLEVLTTIHPDLTIGMLPVVVAVTIPQDYPPGLLAVVAVVTLKTEVVVVAVTALEPLAAPQPALQVVATVTLPPASLDQSTHQLPLR